MITLTEERAQGIEQALDFAVNQSEYPADDLFLYGQALEVIRLARGVSGGHECPPREPVAILHVKKLKFHDAHINNHEWIEWLQPKVDGMKLYSEPVEPFTLTHRELELLDGMIESQLYHSERCGKIDNRPMAEKQIGWNNERIELLRRVRNSSTILKESP